MPVAMTIKNIPDNVYQKLKVSAQTNRRSLNSEAIVVLEAMLLPVQISLIDRLILRHQQINLTEVHETQVDRDLLADLVAGLVVGSDDSFCIDLDIGRLRVGDCKGVFRFHCVILSPSAWMVRGWRIKSRY